MGDAGVAQVPSPLQNVVLDAPVPLFKFPMGRLPVTAFARFTCDHVPSPLQNVVLDAPAPPLRLATGKLPVTPLARLISGRAAEIIWPPVSVSCCWLLPAYNGPVVRIPGPTVKLVV